MPEYELRLSQTLLPAAEPLHRRAPAVDENGRALSDFMILIPGLRDLSRAGFQKTAAAISSVLARYQHAVVFAELNVRLNLLWVSIRPLDGIRFEIAGAMQELVPEAKLVTHI